MQIFLVGFSSFLLSDYTSLGTAGLSSVDLFVEVDPIVKGGKEILDYDLMAALSIKKDRLVEGCTTVHGGDGDDSKWENLIDDRCALDLFDDDKC